MTTATIMDNLQYKSKHVEHNCFSTLTESTELADFCLKNKEDHLQDGLNIYIQAWQDQGEQREVSQQPITITEGCSQISKQQNSKDTDLPGSPPCEHWNV